MNGDEYRVVVVVRHGETAGNRTKRYQLPHPPLNDTGEGQAALAAKALAKTRIGRLVASPLSDADSLPTRTTRAPCRLNACARPAPIPPAAPVTTTTRPAMP